MKESMPDISFERSMNHNYMILSKCSFFGKSDNHRDYRAKMLLENRIPGLLPVTHRMVNGDSRYYYEINSLQSLDRLYDKAEIGYDELRSLLSGCVNLFCRLEEYLLDGTQIIMKPEMIYMNVEKMEPYFVCYPDYEGDVRLSFMELIDDLLTRIDHTDERAVMLGYQVYRYTRNPNYVVSEIGNRMDHAIVSMVHSEAFPSRNESDSSRERPWTGFDIKQPVQYGDTGQAGTESSTGNRECFAMYTGEEGQDMEAVSDTVRRKKGKINDLAGGIFCIFVALCSGVIILVTRITHTFKIGRTNELYLFGAMGMAVMAAFLFFFCHIKKRRQNQNNEPPDEDNGQDDFLYYTAAREGQGKHEHCCGQAQDTVSHVVQSIRFPVRNRCGETEYLGDRSTEERMLYGRVNGREVSISLDRLPMTVGKLANVSDLVIDDAAVSKMHARFEEHDGRVYICDLNSTNGTVRNGVLLGVNQSVALEPGDRLRFGRTYFTYC